MNIVPTSRHLTLQSTEPTFLNLTLTKHVSPIKCNDPVTELSNFLDPMRTRMRHERTLISHNLQFPFMLHAKTSLHAIPATPQHVKLNCNDCQHDQRIHNESQSFCVLREARLSDHVSFQQNCGVFFIVFVLLIIFLLHVVQLLCEVMITTTNVETSAT